LDGTAYDVFVTPPASLPSWAGLVEVQNLIVERFLAGNYDFLWLVELDVQVPPDSFQKLFALDVDVACGYVRRHNGEGLILGFLDENMRVWYLPQNAVQANVLSGWVMAGTSCLLIKRQVFASGYRFKFLPNVTPDILFMFEVQRMGFVAKVHAMFCVGTCPNSRLPSERER
jgi:hypothetical protein